MLKNNWKIAEEILKNDGVVVLPTDTLYGIVGCAISKKVIERIYKIKGRHKKKPFIILITSYKHLDLFGIKLGEEQAKFLKKIWPGKVTVILPCSSKKFEYIHRGVKSIAFRMIKLKNKNLHNLISRVGPLVAPSANNEGGKPAETVKEAQNYFGDEIDFYLSGGILKSEPSTLIRIKDGKIEVLRQGQIVIK